MSIEKRAFGILPDGTAVEQYCLTASGGLKVSVLTYGATLQAVKFAGKDVILGYDRLEDYNKFNPFDESTWPENVNGSSGQQTPSPSESVSPEPTETPESTQGPVNSPTTSEEPYVPAA